MGYVIAMAGKGGTGKTTTAALLVRVLKEKKAGSILAIDADPNSNLAEALGLQLQKTIGQILDEVAAHPENIPQGTPKERFIDFQVQMSIQEADGFDVLTMGKPEGPGCYCYVNNVLRGIMGKLVNDYDYVIVDNEAGLEHLSRRTTRQADCLIAVSDTTPVGLKAVKRINELTKQLEIKVNKRYLILNRNSKDAGDSLMPDLGMEFLGSIPEDEQVLKISRNGSSLIKLDDDSLSLNALRKLGEKICQSNS